jgi:hypothetical protein
VEPLRVIWKELFNEQSSGTGSRGAEAIAMRFSGAMSGRKVLIPYIMAGDPDLERRRKLCVPIGSMWI